MISSPPTTSQLDAPNTLISHPLQKSTKRTAVTLYGKGVWDTTGTLDRDDRVLVIRVCPFVKATIKK